MTSSVSLDRIPLFQSMFQSDYIQDNVVLALEPNQSKLLSIPATKNKIIYLIRPLIKLDTTCPSTPTPPLYTSNINIKKNHHSKHKDVLECSEGQENLWSSWAIMQQHNNTAMKFNIFLSSMDWQQAEEVEAEEFVLPPYPTLELAFLEQPHEPYQCSTLFVATYGAGSLFAHSLVGNTPPANRINFSRQKQHSLADLYLVANSAFLIFNDHPDAMRELHLAKFLQTHLRPERTVVLHALSKTTLKEPTGCSLAHIATSAFAEKQSLPRFAEGVMGVAADLLQWGEINRRPVCCFVGLFGEYELSSEIIEESFGALRGRLGMNGNAEISERVRKYNMRKYANKLYL